MRVNTNASIRQFVPLQSTSNVQQRPSTPVQRPQEVIEHKPTASALPIGHRKVIDAKADLSLVDFDTLPVGSVPEAAPTTASVPGEQVSSQEPLTLPGLLDAWGKSDSPYDLDGNGTVDVDDLLSWIANNSTPSPQEPIIGNAPDAVVQPTPADKPIEAPTTVADSPLPPAPEPSAPPVAAPAGPLTLQGLLEAWGDANSPYDHNGDNTVNVDDLLLQIQKLPNPNGSIAARREPRESQVNDIRPGASASRTPAGLRNLADRLIDRLTSAGFDDQPPTNIRELVDTFNLSPNQSSSVMKHLEAKYPRGLGVNMVG